jgi:hypothetical protein
MKTIQTVQFSFVYEGANAPLTTVIAGVTIGTDDGSGLTKQYATRYTLSSSNQTALADIATEVIDSIKADEGIE